MTRIIRFGLVVLALLVVGAIGLPSTGSNSLLGQIVGPVEAVAQQAKKKKRRSLFNILFGRKKAKKKSVRKRPRRKIRKTSRKKRKAKSKTAKRRTKSSKRRRTAAAAATAPVVVEKLEDAKTVLVVGDFFAGGLADGLEKALLEVANVRVVDKSNGLSGFVRNDIVDWPVVLKPMIEEFKPAYVVAMLGSNDRQLMRVGGEKIKTRTPEWDAAYIKRVESFGKVLKASGLPYAWVGLPPVRFKSTSKDWLYFNEQYGKVAKSQYGQFFDVWDGFSDAEGNYSRSGPDVNGQIVMLRPKDGINLTRAGKSRLAFYIQGDIIKKLGGSSGSTDTASFFDIETTSPGAPEYDPARTGKTVVVRLDDPSADGGEILAGEKIDLNNAIGQSYSVPVLNAPQPVSRTEGRVDDHVWPPAGLPQNASRPAVASTN